jgi:hypothetical protein
MPGARSFDSSSGIRRSRSVRSRRTRPRARASGRCIRTSRPWPAGSSSRPRRTPWPATTWSSSPCRTGPRPPWPPSFPTRSSSWTAERTSAFPTRPRGPPSTTPRMPVAGPTVSPNFPARPGPPAARPWPEPGGSPSPAATRRRARWRWRPASPRACSTRRRRHRRRQRDVRCRQVPQAAPAQRRDHGGDVALRGRGSAPAYPGDRAEPHGRRGHAGDRVVHAHARPDVPRHPRHLHRPLAPASTRPPSARPGRRHTPTRPSSTSCPRAPGPGPPTSWAATASTSR